MYTEEEVERNYEDFYDDVHTEFLKFGEIVNFKVCRNGSFHLRGNVYVQYKSLDSAVMAYSSVHARYFAGKQVKCEFVSLTRWKVAICGEYMKSRLKTCSRGSACNFLHCFSNPGGDYEWADCDKLPPRYWVKKMTALFGYSDEIDQLSPKDRHHSPRIVASDRDSFHYKRHQSIDRSQHGGSSNRSYREETHARKSRHGERRGEDNYVYEDEMEYKNNHQETDSDGDQLDRKRRDRSENHSMYIRRESKSRGNRRTPTSRGSSSDEDLYTHAYTKRKSRHSRHRPGRSRSHESADKNDTSDRWQPHSEQMDHNSKLDVNDYEISNERKPKDQRINHETRSGSVVEDASKEMQHSRDHDDRTREKRKRI